MSTMMTNIKRREIHPQNVENILTDITKRIGKNERNLALQINITVSISQFTNYLFYLPKLGMLNCIRLKPA